jgi:hypothetical protein
VILGFLGSFSLKECAKSPEWQGMIGETQFLFLLFWWELKKMLGTPNLKYFIFIPNLDKF